MTVKRDDLDKKQQTGAAEVPGNAVQSQLLFDRWLMKQGMALNDAPHLLEKAFDRGIEVTRVSIAMPTFDKPEYLVIATGTVDGAPHVAFHNAPTLAEAFVGFFDRLKNGSLKWKPDQYKKH